MQPAALPSALPRSPSGPTPAQRHGRRTIWSCRVSLAALLDLGDERDAVITRARDATHDPHHRAVGDGLVAANVNKIVGAAVAGIDDRFELREKIVELNLVLLQEDLSLLVDRNRQRLVVLLERFGLALRQIDRDPDG